MAYLHGLEHPIAHGSIRPEDILITDDLKAVLCDFGHSRVMMPEPLHTGFTTEDGAIAPRFAAKELLLDPAKATPMSDVYGMGGTILVVRFLHRITFLKA